MRARWVHCKFCWQRVRQEETGHWTRGGGETRFFCPGTDRLHYPFAYKPRKVPLDLKARCAWCKNEFKVLPSMRYLIARRVKAGQPVYCSRPCAQHDAGYKRDRELYGPRGKGR